MTENRPHYIPAVASNLLGELGVTRYKFDDEDLILIEPGREEFAVYRIPSLSAERLKIYDELLKQDRPLGASREEVQAAFFAIPFYNPTKNYIAGREGIRVIENEDVRVKAPSLDNKGEEEEYELPSHANIMWQPNLAGRLLSRFVTANARYSFFGGRSDVEPDELARNTGYWIDLRNFRSTMYEIEPYHPPLDSGGPGIIRPVHGNKVTFDLMPGYLRVKESFASNEPIAHNLYVVAWDIPDSSAAPFTSAVTERPAVRAWPTDVPKPSQYTIYCMTRAYWAERMPDLLKLNPSDLSYQNLVKYVIDTQSQVAALTNWEANAIGIANHGLCCVVNLSSFTK